MKIQPVNCQPNAKGTIVVANKKGVAIGNIERFLPLQLKLKYREAMELVKNKPYDLFIYKNPEYADFYTLSAGNSLAEAQKAPSKVNLRKNTLDAIVSAVEDILESR